MAAGSYGKTVQIWETATVRLVQTLGGHRGGIDGEVHIWAVESGVCLRTLRDEGRRGLQSTSTLVGR